MTPFILAALCAGGATGWYQWTGRVRPFVPCRSCNGIGYKLASRRFALLRVGDPFYVECGACETTGQRLRWAARHRTRHDPAKREAIRQR